MPSLAGPVTSNATIPSSSTAGGVHSICKCCICLQNFTRVKFQNFIFQDSSMPGMAGPFTSNAAIPSSSTAGVHSINGYKCCI